jgi:hypothetical protein
MDAIVLVHIFQWDNPARTMTRMHAMGIPEEHGRVYDYEGQKDIKVPTPKEPR